jgi:hypothetical protein
MKRQAALVLSGLIAVTAIFGALMLCGGFRSACPASITFVRYSQSATSIWVVFQVTNRSASAFCCAIGPRERGRIQEGTAVVVRAVPARGAAEVCVPLATCTNVWRFKVRLDELRSVRNWESRMRLILARIGIRIPRGRTYDLLTPTLPEFNIEAAVEQSGPSDALLPFRFE